MMLLNLAFLLLSLFILAKSAGYAVKYSMRIARLFNLPEFVISFALVALISAFPEATISIMSAIKGMPELSVAVLLGSNVADLAVVTGIAALVSKKGIKIKSDVLKKSFFCLVLLLLPVLLGLDGEYSRIDGTVLVASAFIFFLSLNLHSHFKDLFVRNHNHTLRSTAILIASLAVLLASAYSTIKFGVLFAGNLKVPPMIIGLTIISLGSCLPEFMFSLKSIRKNHSSLALGDILGTVVTDATLIFGIIALINPFTFDKTICYVTGISMVIAGGLLVAFMETGKLLTKKEGVLLLVFYVVSITVEILVKV